MKKRFLKRGISAVMTLVMSVGLFGLTGISGWAETKPKEIIIACSQDSYPFHYADAAGNAVGINIDFWNLWSKKTGIGVKYLISDWDTSLRNVKEKKADIHAGCFYTKERDDYLDYGSPIVDAQTHIFYNANLRDINGLADIEPYTIGVLKGDYAENYIRTNLKDASIRPFLSYDALMEAARTGKIQVFVADTLTALYVMDKTIPAGLFTYNLDQPLYTNYFYAAAQEGETELIQRINNGLGTITAAERNVIIKKWLPQNEGKKSVRVAISMDYPPFSYPDQYGNPQGLLIDLWNLWGTKTNTEVKFIITSWSDTISQVEKGESDIHSGLFFSEDRSRGMDFSVPVYSIESRIFFNKKYRSYDSIKDLQGKIIGANKDSYQEAYLKEHFPEMKVLSFDSSFSMTEAADKGLIDAFIEETTSVKGSYQMLNKPFEDAAMPDMEFRRDMLAGVTKNKPELLKQVNQGLEQITKTEWIQMETKWIQDPADRIYHDGAGIQLTEEEKAWIKQHPVLRIGINGNQNPLEYDDEGTVSGISIDYARYILGQAGIVPEIKQMKWPDILKGIQTGETVDASFNIQKTDERSKTLAFSNAYLKVPHVIVTKAAKKLINSFSELAGRTVAVEKGYYKIEHLRKDASIKLLEVDTSLDALLAVSSGRADAYIGDKLTTTQTISVHSLKNLRIREYTDLKTYDVSVGFRKEMAPLAGIINKVLFAMTDSEKRKILSKYTDLSDEGGIILTEAEQVWLRNHNPVRTGIQTGWAPVEYINELNELSGISSDYSSRIERLLNIQLGAVKSASYSELVEMMRTGKLDMMTAAVKSPYLLKFMDFSKPYMISPMALITLDESPFVGGIDSIAGEKLGVIKDSYAEDVLKQYYSNLAYASFADGDQLYRALSDKSVDLILDSMASIDYMGRLHGIQNLRVSGITEYTYEICIGIRRDWPMTLGIVNRLLDSVSTVEKDSTEKYWLTNLPPDRQTMERNRQLIINLAAVILVIVGIILFWNRKLQREINERKTIGIQLTAAKEAADVANLSKTEFLANMSHEIRTPMNAVIGMATLMDRTELSYTQRDYLNKIVQATYNLLGIINDILDFSKIEAGRMELESVEFDLETVLDNVAGMTAIKAKDKNLELIISKDANLPVRLVGDPLRLEQVILNLVSNAIKFTHEGEVQIHVSGTKQSEDHALINFSIRDTGIGMAEEQVSRLFQPFTQSDSSTTRKFGGTGLGLSISKKLVDLMGGRIWAMCRIEGGCQFSFEVLFPYTEQGDESSEGLQENTLSQLRVLLVEDNPSARDVMEGYLRDFKVMTDSFETGEEALEALEIRVYDLILMDWKLGGMDGLETVKRIREMPLVHRPKIILVTAYGDEGIMENSDEKGLDDVIIKPVSESALFNSIQNLFIKTGDRKKWFPPKRMRLNELFLSGKRILVVEDNAMNQQLAKELLQSVGGKADVVGNGIEALTRLKSDTEGYDVIFMDLQMPEMGGYEATSEIRKLERWMETPIIAMTADVLPGIYESCITGGMNDYISKPVSVDELYEKLAFWLEIKEQPYYAEDSSSVNMGLTAVDPSKAIRNLGGNLELYKLVLNTFAETYGDFDTEVQRLLEMDVREDALRYFHTLKGHGGNLGSDLITKEAERGEKLLKDGEMEELRKVSESLGDHIKTLISEIKSNPKLWSRSAEQADRWGPPKLKTHLEELLKSLKSRRPADVTSQISVIMQHRVPEVISGEWEDLKSQCERYRYKEAELLIAKITEKLDRELQ